MPFQRIARRYAKALLESALKEQSADRVEQDVDAILRAYASSPDFRMMMRSPVIQASKKAAIFDELFGATISPLTRNFLVLLSEKGREGNIVDVAAEFRAQLDVYRKQVRVDVTSAVELGDSERANLIAAVTKRLGKQVLATFSVDSGLLAGVRIKVGDTVIDDSLHHQLLRLRSTLAMGAPTNN
ncbi:MAG: ATP synthase F1 subunit delta [Candidatus Kapabacteria bacterium]|jgi:F-type H+-transporting ATPase subunit delta|nr:ATP synthase F1 subunit delta [Candidatus Kapabacteria bacterium]